VYSPHATPHLPPSRAYIIVSPGILTTLALSQGKPHSDSHPEFAKRLPVKEISDPGGESGFRITVSDSDRFTVFRGRLCFHATLTSFCNLHFARPLKHILRGRTWSLAFHTDLPQKIWIFHPKMAVAPTDTVPSSRYQPEPGPDVKVLIIGAGNSE